MNDEERMNLRLLLRSLEALLNSLERSNRLTEYESDVKEIRERMAKLEPLLKP